MSYLRHFPFDKIKIDRSFIRDIADGDKKSLAIVKSVIAIADSLDLVTTAEGVETNQQLATLRLIGCTEIQGFIFSPPKPVAEIRPLLVLGRAEVQSAA